MDKSINEQIAEETMNGKNMNRAERRKIDKLLKGMSENDKKHLIMAVQQDTVARIVKKTDERLVLNVYHSAFEYLYKTFLLPIKALGMSEEQKKQQVQKMVDFILEESAKYILEKEKMKTLVKQKEGGNKDE